MTRTYSKSTKTAEYRVTVEPRPGKGFVIEHPWNSRRGSGYGRKHEARFPRFKAWRIGRELRRAGYSRTR